MSKTPRKVLLISACLISSFGRIDHVIPKSKTVQERERAEPISFCELAKHPECYVDKLIKTSAIFLSHFPDVWFMYDEKCSDKRNRVTDYLACKSVDECERLKKLSALYRNGDGERWRNKMVVVGKLHIVSSQKRSEPATNMLRFAISDIKSVSAVPNDVPWP